MNTHKRIPASQVISGDVVDVGGVPCRVREVTYGAEEVRVLLDGYPTQFYARNATVGCWRP